MKQKFFILYPNPNFAFMSETQDTKKMSFFGHLEELRWRLVKSAIVILAFAIVLFVFRKEAMDHVFLSMLNPDFPTYVWFCDVGQMMGVDDLCIKAPLDMTVTTDTMMGEFSAAMFYSIIGGIILAFPFLFYQIWTFLKPGLKLNEINASKGILVYTSFLFFLGVAFGYFILSPLCVQFAGTFELSAKIVRIPSISSYMSMIVFTTFYTGLIFELPVLIFLLTKIGVLGPAFLRKYRKHAIVVVLILSAIITPPDVLSQVIVSIPIIILYEISILISSRVEKSKLKAKTNS